MSNFATLTLLERVSLREINYSQTLFNSSLEGRFKVALNVVTVKDYQNFFHTALLRAKESSLSGFQDVGMLAKAFQES